MAVGLVSIVYWSVWLIWFVSSVWFISFLSAIERNEPNEQEGWDRCLGEELGLKLLPPGPSSL